MSPSCLCLIFVFKKNGVDPTAIEPCWDTILHEIRQLSNYLQRYEIRECFARRHINTVRPCVSFKKNYLKTALKINQPSFHPHPLSPYDLSQGVFILWQKIFFGFPFNF